MSIWYHRNKWAESAAVQFDVALVDCLIYRCNICYVCIYAVQSQWRISLLTRWPVRMFVYLSHFGRCYHYSETTRTTFSRHKAHTLWCLCACTWALFNFVGKRSDVVICIHSKSQFVLVKNTAKRLPVKAANGNSYIKIYFRLVLLRSNTTAVCPPIPMS